MEKDTNKKVSVVIAAYNEEPRISNVLKVIKNHPLVDETIVIDDGSTDNTSEVAKRYKVKLIENKDNLGKTLAIKKGIESAKNDLILLLDADLKRLDSEAVTKLIEPVMNEKVDWTLSLRGNSLWYMKLLKIDWISGERVIPRELLADPLIWSKPKISYSLETLMNKSLLDKKATFYSVYLPNVFCTPKTEKIGFIKGWLGEFKMTFMMLKVLPPHKIIGQFLTMAYLNKKYKNNLIAKQSLDEA
jgi:glycosyltransferase involved in cell wall biosynthesis